MKGIKTELKKMNAKELQEKINELRRELFKVRLTAASSSLKNTAQLKKLRNDIARGLTFLREKESHV